MVKISNVSPNPMLIENITTQSNRNKANTMRKLKMNINRTATIKASGFLNKAMKTYNNRILNMVKLRNKLTMQLKNLKNKQNEKQRYITSYANVPNKNQLAAMRRGDVALKGAMRLIKSNLMNVDRNISTLNRNRDAAKRKAIAFGKSAVARMKNRIANQLRKTSNAKISKRANKNRRKLGKSSARASTLNRLFRTS